MVPSFRLLSLRVKSTQSVLLFSSLLAFAIPSVGFAEPSWLKGAIVDAEGIKPHRGVTAIVLYNTAEVQISSNCRAKTRLRVAYKIVKPGSEDFSTFSQSVSPFLKLEDFKGWHLLPDGSEHKISRNSVVEIGTPGTAGYYDDSRVALAEFSDIREGSIVAYECKIEDKGLSGCFQRFVFQGQQPVSFTQLSLDVPKGWDVHKWEWNIDGFSYEELDNRRIWTARNLGFQPDERLMPSWRYVSKVVAVTCYDPEESGSFQFLDWPSVGRWCGEIMDPYGQPDESISSLVSQITEGLDTPEQKLLALFEFVRDDIRYVAVELSAGRWVPREAAATLRNRYGDCKDKTALLRAMLKSIGIESVAVLAGVRCWTSSTLPTPVQFNHCLVGIPLSDVGNVERVSHSVAGGWFFCDPTDPATPLGRLPAALQGSLVLIGADAEPAVYELPRGAPAEWRRRYEVRAQLAPDGSVSGEMTVKDYGTKSFDTRYRRRATTEKEQVEEWQAMLSQTLPACKISDYSVGAAGDSAWASFRLEDSGYLVRADTVWLFKPNILQSAGPPALTDANRIHPIWFGPPARVEIDVTWRLPEGWTAEMDTLSVDSGCGAARVFCRTERRGEVIRISSVLDLNGIVLPAEEYEEARRLIQDISRTMGLTAFLRRPP